jgi:hypothetical protein
MSTKRKPNSGDPRKHPGNDILTVVCPAPTVLPPDGVALEEWFELHPPESQVDDVTRDEFQRRMAGSAVLDTLHEAGRNVRVITLMEPTAIEQWWDTA